MLRAYAVAIAGLVGVAGVTLAAATGAEAIRPPSVGSPALPAQVPDPANDPSHVVLSALHPSAGKAFDDRSIVYTTGCHVGAQSVTTARFCVFGDKKAKRTVVLIGDSHAAQWFPAFDRATRSLHVRLLYLTRSACPGEAVSVRAGGGYYQACDAWRESAYSLIKKLPRVDVVVVGISAHAVLLSHDTHRPIVGQSARAAEWAAGIRRTVTALGGAARAVLLLRDTPLMSKKSGPCLIATKGDNQGCGTPYARALAGSVWVAQQTVAEQYPKVGTADFTEAFCTSSRCLPVTNTGVLRWRDRGHMTLTFGRLLTPLVEPVLRDALAGNLTN